MIGSQKSADDRLHLDRRSFRKEEDKGEDEKRPEFSKVTNSMLQYYY